MWRDRFCRLYTTGQGVGNAVSIIERLEALGVSLEFPATGRVIQLGAEGQQEPTARSEFLERLQSEIDISFQLWRSTSEDIYCRVQRIFDATRIEFGMDGMDRRDMDAFTLHILNMVSWLAKESVLIGIMIDRTGSSAEEDWDAFFLGDGRLPQLIPEVLGLRATRAPMISAASDAASKEEIDGFVLFRSAVQ